MFNIVTDLVDGASCTWQHILDFLASAGFVIYTHLHSTTVSWVHSNYVYIYILHWNTH